MKYDNQFIEAMYGGENEYFIAPDKTIYEIKKSEWVEEPRAYSDGYAGKSVAYSGAEYNNTSDRVLADALIEELSEEELTEAKYTFLQNHADRHTTIYGGQQHITYEIEGYEEPIEIDMPDDDYTLDDLFVALDYTIIHEMWEEPLDRVAVLTLAREGDLPQIPFLKEYTSYAVYETQKHLDEIGVSKANAAREFKSACETFEAYYDGQTYEIEEYDIKGESDEAVYFAYGDKDVIESLPDGSKSVGLYKDIYSCIEDNQEELGITVDPLPSFESRIHMVESMAKQQAEPSSPIKDNRDER